MPTAFAAAKWPSSWRIDEHGEADEREEPAHGLGADPSTSAGPLAGVGVGVVEVGEVADGCGGSSRRGRGRSPRAMPVKRQLAVEERVHRDLVGGVQDAGRGAARRCRFAGQAQAREGVRRRAPRTSAGPARRGRAPAPARPRAPGGGARRRSARACPGSRGARARRRRSAATSAWMIDCGCTTTSIRS